MCPDSSTCLNLVRAHARASAGHKGSSGQSMHLSTCFGRTAYFPDYAMQCTLMHMHLNLIQVMTVSNSSFSPFLSF